MIREKWNSHWHVSKPGENPMMASVTGGGAAASEITLPHDAMIHEKRTQNTKNQHQTGFYPGGIYEYTKQFEVPADWAEKQVFVEFEGVYEQARVFVNGDYVGGHPYGYTGFTLKLNDFLKYGQPNEIKVTANNSTEENSRWYSGSGIYRDVNLYTAGPLYIPVNGLKIRTPEIEEDCATVQTDVTLVNASGAKRQIRVITEICDAAGQVVAADNTRVTLFANAQTHICQRILVDEPKLWDPDEPNLYGCTVRLMDGEEVLDTVNDHFGIRTLTLNAKHGLRLNGKEIKLRGSCIHHDNGVIGAATLPRAEERRCEQLKAAGFNCLRSSHHPMSRAMLDACDRLGMLVLDELFDCWTRTKNNNDYANRFPDCWKTDAEAMVDKDYNHPSVIMYITGNEIQEAATPKGAQMNREIMDYLHALDADRYVTVAINGLLACMDRLGEIMCSIMGITMEQMMEMMAAQAAQAPAGDAGTDVDQANGSADLMKGPMADAFAVNEIVTDLLEEFGSVTDLTSYNNLTARHEMEHALYPNRVILGTETLPSDIVRLWKIVKGNPHVIGDMTWTGWDYLGEASAGCFFYDGRVPFTANWPVSLACMGDIDILGVRHPMSYFREIVYGLRTKPFIAVERLNHYGQTPTKSAWPWKDEIASWTWDGYEGKPAVVNIYSNANEVELFLNGESFGRKAVSEETEYYAAYEVTYQPGELKAVSYRTGTDGGIIEETDTLVSADPDVRLKINADKTALKADGADLAFLTVTLADAQGRQNLQAVKEVTVQVEGAGTLQGYGSADPATPYSYDDPTQKTYDGYLLAVVRAGFVSGEIKVTFSAEGCRTQSVMLKVE